MAPASPRRRRAADSDGLGRLLADTQDVVGRLLRENRLLKAQNKRLADELDRVSKGWDEVRRLARAAPRGKRR